MESARDEYNGIRSMTITPTASVRTRKVSETTTLTVPNVRTSRASASQALPKLAWGLSLATIAPNYGRTDYPGCRLALRTIYSTVSLVSMLRGGVNPATTHLGVLRRATSATTDSASELVWRGDNEKKERH